MPSHHSSSSHSSHSSHSSSSSSSGGFFSFIALILLSLLFNRAPSVPSPYNNQQSTNNQQQYASNPDIFGNTIYLAKNSNGNYSVTSNQSEAEYVLKYDKSEDSYYCEELDEWFWYNTDVVPPIWQYWTESISGNYGEYGWMEHDSDGWWIETSEGNWEKVPSRYNTSNLIYIE
jgi:hypothetical protein